LAIGGQVILNLEQNDYFKIGIRTMEHNDTQANLWLSRMYSKLRIEKFVYTGSGGGGSDISLTNYSDASFGNVDISGTLTIDGSNVAIKDDVDASLNNLTSSLAITDASVNSLTSSLAITDASVNSLTSSLAITDASVNSLTSSLAITDASVNSLSIDQLTNVNITDLANNDVLQYNSTTGVWDNGVLLPLPYFLKVQLLADDNTGVSDTTDYVLGVDGSEEPLVPQFSSSFNYNNGDWDETTSIWTCPVDGIYRINAQVSFKVSSSLDKIRQTQIDFYKNGDNVARNGMIVEAPASGDDDFIQYDPQLNTLLEFSAGDTFQMKLTFEKNDAPNMIIRKSVGGTFICFERVAQ
jgi:hypothetical protein